VVVRSDAPGVAVLRTPILVGALAVEVEPVALIMKYNSRISPCRWRYLHSPHIPAGGIQGLAKFGREFVLVLVLGAPIEFDLREGCEQTAVYLGSMCRTYIIDAPIGIRLCILFVVPPAPIDTVVPRLARNRAPP
jgi:hypothetical protein